MHSITQSGDVSYMQQPEVLITKRWLLGNERFDKYPRLKSVLHARRAASTVLLISIALAAQNDCSTRLLMLWLYNTGLTPGKTYNT